MYVSFEFQSIVFYVPEPFEKYEVRGAELFVLSLLRAHDGAEDIVQFCFVQSKIIDVSFFASTVKLGKKGVEAFIETDLKGFTEDEAVGKTMISSYQTNYTNSFIVKSSYTNNFIVKLKVKKMNHTRTPNKRDMNNGYIYICRSLL